MDKMDLNCYTSRLEINLDTIGRNLEKIRCHTGGLELLPVVKSNAYGFGTVAIANHLVHHCGIKIFAVARVFEACQVLDSGCTEAEILILGPVPSYSFPTVVARGIQIPLFRIEDVRLLSEESKRQGKPYVKVHIKVETGMNRIGARPGDELAKVLESIHEAGNIVVDGVFTHFATADIANHGAGNDFTREQFSCFCEGLSQIRAAGFEPRRIHCCNTGATVWFKDAYKVCTHVRMGSLYLGYSSIQDDWNPIGVEESGSWKTFISNLRTIHPGESVGYGRTFMPDHIATVAVIPVGYGDGYARSFAVHGAPALINGTRCKFVGTCMDMSFIDVTGLDCKLGDEVTLFGEDGKGNRIAGLEIGHLMGETRLAMFSHITERVARVYLTEQK